MNMQIFRSEPEGRYKAAGQAIGRPGASAQMYILSGTHERTGFFQVRANMSSHFKIAKKKEQPF